MKQEQKDTIREEEILEKINQIFRTALATHKPIQDIAVDMYKAGMAQGAKDKVEEVLKSIPKERPMTVFSFHLHGEELETYMQYKGYNKCRSEIKEAIESLKDNT